MLLQLVTWEARALSRPFVLSFFSMLLAPSVIVIWVPSTQQTCFTPVPIVYSLWHVLRLATDIFSIVLLRTSAIGKKKYIYFYVFLFSYIPNGLGLNLETKPSTQRAALQLSRFIQAKQLIFLTLLIQMFWASIFLFFLFLLHFWFLFLLFTHLFRWHLPFCRHPFKSFTSRWMTSIICTNISPAPVLFHLFTNLQILNYYFLFFWWHVHTYTCMYLRVYMFVQNYFLFEWCSSSH